MRQFLFPLRQLGSPVLSVALCTLLIGSLFVLSTSPLQSQGLRPSWRDLGNSMIGQRKLDSARYYLEKWVDADPRDESSWYNLACVYALQGDNEEAINAFESSVEAGWSDPVHPMNDSDLESIRSDPRFLAAIESIRSGESANGPKGFERRFVETKTIGTYIAMLPPDYGETDRTYPLCVILHGSGSTELGHGRVADMVGRDGVIYIAPRALNARNVGDKVGYTAWPIDEIDSLDPLYTRSAPNYADLIRACVQDARQNYRVDPGKVMVLGHSQGAAFSYITAAFHPDMVRSVLAYAGYFPDTARTPDKIDRLQKEKVKIMLLHGTDDQSVDIEESRNMEAFLKENGVEVEAHFFEGVDHSIRPEVLEKMTEWVDRESGRAGQ